MSDPEPSRKSAGRLKRWLLEAAVFVAIFLAIQAWQQRDVPRGEAPGVVGTLADGQPFELGAWRASHAGSVVALHFWAEWCPICKSEQGGVSAVARDWPVVTVAMQSGKADMVNAYLKKNRLAWTTVVDDTGRISSEYGLKGVPAFVVIDRRGIVRSVSTGYTTELGMRARLAWAAYF